MTANEENIDKKAVREKLMNKMAVLSPYLSVNYFTCKWFKPFH